MRTCQPTYLNSLRGSCGVANLFSEYARGLLNILINNIIYGKKVIEKGSRGRAG